MRAITAVLLVAVLGACDSGRPGTRQRSREGSELPVSIPFELVGFHPGARSDLGTYFVVVDIERTPNDQAKRDCLNIGRNLCSGKTVCSVLFWSDRDKAARSIPMTDAQVAAQIASYNKNVNSGRDTLVCHPFGPPGERCS